MLKINYTRYLFRLELEKETFFDIHPLFLLRSVLGSELKKMCCIFSREKKQCINCTINSTCAYALIFETVINKQSGAHFTSHPFILYTPQDTGHTYNFIEFNLTLLGISANYFPYIFQAFTAAGNRGLFKSRVKYRISRVTSNDTVIFDGTGSLVLPPVTQEWIFSPSAQNSAAEKKIRLEFITPFKYLPQNRTRTGLDYPAISDAILRRLKIVSSLFGTNALSREYQISCSARVTANCTVWKDYDRYSARQQTEMKMGGFTGHMDLTGQFSNDELILLRGAEIFNIGKSISFGLGKIAIKKI